MPIRTVNSYHSPRIPIPQNWSADGTTWVGGGAGGSCFSITSEDPNTNGYPQWYATGRAGIDGNFTVAIEDGFSPTVNLIAWEWNKVARKWFRLGANDGLYELAFDATYTMGTFQVSESAYVLIQSSAVITGLAYMDGSVDPDTVGYLQEG